MQEYTDIIIFIIGFGLGILSHMAYQGQIKSS